MNSSVGSTQATVRPGETAQATIQLQGGPVIAKAFVIHFARDSAFIEPPMRPVLRQVAEYAAAHPMEKLLIVGHTDLTGSAEYNQSLSERRARSVHAFLTYGSDSQAAIAEWDALRIKRPAGKLPSMNDSWGVREYQYMLQDLGYYIGKIDGQHGIRTNQAIRGFQHAQQLAATGKVTPETWNRMITMYLALAEDWAITPEFRFIYDHSGSLPLHWLGCGQEDPVKNTQDSWRPNRRAECLFVRVDTLPCKVAAPVTNGEGIPYTDVDTSTVWEQENVRCGFAFRDHRQLNDQAGSWLIQPVDTRRVRVSGAVFIHENGEQKPLAGAKYALISPDGEYLHNNEEGQPDLGERAQGDEGNCPIWNKTGLQGDYGDLQSTPVGIYQLLLPDIESPQVVKAVSSTSPVARGNATYFLALQGNLPYAAPVGVTSFSAAGLSNQVSVQVCQYSSEASAAIRLELPSLQIANSASFGCKRRKIHLSTNFLPLSYPSLALSELHVAPAHSSIELFTSASNGYRVLPKHSAQDSLVFPLNDSQPLSQDLYIDCIVPIGSVIQPPHSFTFVLRVDSDSNQYDPNILALSSSVERLMVVEDPTAFLKGTRDDDQSNWSGEPKLACHYLARLIAGRLIGIIDYSFKEMNDFFRRKGVNVGWLVNLADLEWEKRTAWEKKYISMGNMLNDSALKLYNQYAFKQVNKGLKRINTEHVEFYIPKKITNQNNGALTAKKINDQRAIAEMEVNSILNKGAPVVAGFYWNPANEDNAHWRVIAKRPTTVLPQWTDGSQYPWQSGQPYGWEIIEPNPFQEYTIDVGYPKDFWTSEVLETRKWGCLGTRIGYFRYSSSHPNEALRNQPMPINW